MTPSWVVALARASLWLAAASALFIVCDFITGTRLRMKVMYLVWPLTALYLGPLAVAAYWIFGRTHEERRPEWQSVALSTSHCGAGCALGDVAGEWIVFGAGLAFFGSRLFADYVFDLALAYAFGLAMQYFAIVPMRGLRPKEGVKAAAKADTASILAFEVGMFGWMALSRLVLFPGIEPTSPIYWFSMQIAMIVGFLTSAPANVVLLRKGLKEAM